MAIPRKVKGANPAKVKKDNAYTSDNQSAFLQSDIDLTLYDENSDSLPDFEDAFIQEETYPEKAGISDEVKNLDESELDKLLGLDDDNETDDSNIEINNEENSNTITETITEDVSSSLTDMNETAVDTDHNLDELPDLTELDLPDFGFDAEENNEEGKPSTIHSQSEILDNIEISFDEPEDSIEFSFEDDDDDDDENNDVLIIDDDETEVSLSDEITDVNEDDDSDEQIRRLMAEMDTVLEDFNEPDENINSSADESNELNEEQGIFELSNEDEDTVIFDDDDDEEDDDDTFVFEEIDEDEDEEDTFSSIEDEEIDEETFAIPTLKKSKEKDNTDDQKDDSKKKEKTKDKKIKDPSEPGFMSNLIQRLALVKEQIAADIRGEDVPKSLPTKGLNEDDEGNNEADDDDEKEAKNKKKKPKNSKKGKKPSNPLKKITQLKIFSPFAKLYTMLVKLCFGLLNGLFGILAKLPIIGKIFKPILSASKKLEKIATALPVVLIVLVLILVSFLSVPRSYNFDELPDNGAVSISKFAYDDGIASATIENKGETILDSVAVDFTIYSIQASWNPKSWIIPQPAKTCTSESVSVDIDGKEQISVACASDIGKLQRVSGELAL